MTCLETPSVVITENHSCVSRDVSNRSEAEVTLSQIDKNILRRQRSEKKPVNARTDATTIMTLSA